MNFEMCVAFDISYKLCYPHLFKSLLRSLTLPTFYGLYVCMVCVLVMSCVSVFVIQS